MGGSNKMADLIGPCYGTATVATLLGCPVEDVASRSCAGDLVVLRTSDGAEVYPVFQFTPTGTVRPELAPVLRALAGQDPWTAAVWLRTRHHDLGETSPVEWLAAGEDPRMVSTLARQWVGLLSA